MVAQVCIDAVRIYRSQPDPISLNAAISLVAVFYGGESQLDPTRENNTGTENGGDINPKGSFAIMQLNGIRQRRLLDYATGKGWSYKELKTQLLFAVTEIWNYYPKVREAIQDQTSSIKTLVDVIVRVYEVPKEPDPEIERSMAVADELAALPASTWSVQPTPSPLPVPLPELEALLQIDPKVIQALVPLIEALAAGFARGIILALKI